jgi:hypothetical protein
VPVVVAVCPREQRTHSIENTFHRDKIEHILQRTHSCFFCLCRVSSFDRDLICMCSLIRMCFVSVEFRFSTETKENTFYREHIPWSL